MKELIGFVEPLLPYILAGLAIFLVWRFGLGFLQSWSAGLGSTFSGAIPAIALTFTVAIVAFAAIVIWQPTFFTTIFGVRGPFGPDRLVAETKADLVAVILEPSIDAKTFSSDAAKSAAEAVASEYQLATAKNKAGISAAEADRLSHLPKGHPDRALWDAAGMDPATGSLPPAAQVSKNIVGEIAKNAGSALAKMDLTATDKELSKPVGSAPTDTEKWVKSIYDLPKGAALFTGLLVLALGLGLTIRLVR